jgi:hypothetical protein
MDNRKAYAVVINLIGGMKIEENSQCFDYYNAANNYRLFKQAGH